MATNYTDAIPAGLLKRLAEAADSFRDGLYHYFICKTTFPYDLHNTQGYPSDSDADCAADDILSGLVNQNDTYYKFGPYKTDSDGEADIEYDSIQVRYLRNDIELYCETFDSSTDAIVLSVSAYDKFFEPYYVRLYGIDAANDLRKNIVAALKSSPRVGGTHYGRSGAISSILTNGTRLAAGIYSLG